MGRRIRSWAIPAAFAFAAAIYLYMIAGAIGGAIPVNRAWTPPRRGVTIWVETNGIHTGIIVPKVAEGIDWRPLLKAEHLADPRHAGWSHASFGWGERAFYLETPTWSKLRPSTVIAAAFGSDRTLMHVDHVPPPRPGARDARAVVLRPEEYRKLAAFLRASFAEAPVPERGYYRRDAFYAARGHYSAIHTCNAWTGRALAAAGVKVGWWTPFPTTVMRWF
jgi:uncharacterized protein (TIGR02117 family)